MMQRITNVHSGCCTLAMIDSGANVNIDPPALAKHLNLAVIPPNDKRAIGTAKIYGLLTITGWIFPTGYTGPIAIVQEAAFTLLAVINMQRNGMGVDFPYNEQTCVLYTQRYTFAHLTRCPYNELYFIDISKLLDTYIPEYIAQPDDVQLTAAHGVIGGLCGYLTKID